MKLPAIIFCCLTFHFGLLHPAGAQELVFASTEEASRILSTRDTFVERMSPFDRAARMKTGNDASEKAFLQFAAAATLEWDSDESRAVLSAFAHIKPIIARLSLPLPNRIYLVKTTGAEEGNAAYTRGNAIILPKRMLASPEREMRRLLAHELFHISSRNYTKISLLLYETIGFQYCGEIEFPAALIPRKITNPDAPKNDYCIRLDVRGESVWAVPILFSRTPRYDTARGGEFFEYLTLALLLVERADGTGRARPLHDAQGPRIVGLDQVSGFIEQVGRNTRYVIHPEEILADNFAILVLGDRDVPTPELLKNMQTALAKARVAESSGAGDVPQAARP
jgi:hypothetical protein